MPNGAWSLRTRWPCSTRATTGCLKTVVLSAEGADYEPSDVGQFKGWIRCGLYPRLKLLWGRASHRRQDYSVLRVFSVRLPVRCKRGALSVNRRPPAKGSYAEQREQIEKLKKEMTMKTLQESNGTSSSIRLGMMLCILTGCAVALIGVWTKQDPVGIGVLVAMLIAPITAGKVAQKGKEA